MCRKYFLFIIVATLFISGLDSGLYSQQSDPQPNITPQFDSLALQQIVKYLASDKLEGRRPGGEGNKLAAEFIATKFRESGLKPAVIGDAVNSKKSKKETTKNSASNSLEGYYNYFSLLNSVKSGQASKAEINFGTTSKSLLLNKDFSIMSFSDSAILTNKEIVFAGYGINAPELQYNDYAGIDAKGKIAVIMRYAPGGNNPHNAFAKYASFISKVRTAKEFGVAGIIFVTPFNDTTNIQSRFDRNFIRCGLPCITVNNSVFALVKDSTNRSLLQIQLEIDSTRKPASFLMAGATANINCDVIVEHLKVPNVVGIIEGSDPQLKKEIIVIGGHFDHLGHGGEGSLHSSHEPAIHYGADDNASGTAGVIATAEAVSKAMTNANYKPRRTLMFICFNGEEMGLLGSAAITENFPLPIQQVVTMINMDMIGRLDSNNLIVQGSGTSPLWETLIKNLVKKDKKDFNIKFVKDGFGPSDHSSFYIKNIPVLFFFTGLHKDYHKPTDTWDKVNYSGMAKVLELVFKSLVAVDSQTEKPEFTKTAMPKSTSGSGFRVYVGTIPDYAFEGKGLRISGVSPNSPAEKAGAKDGDIFVRMNSKKIDNIYDYTDALGSFKVGDEVETEVLRGSEKVILKIVMGSRQ